MFKRWFKKKNGTATNFSKVLKVADKIAHINPVSGTLIDTIKSIFKKENS